MPLTVRVPSTAPGARFTTYAVVLSDEVDDLDLVPVSCECKGWRFHGHCKHGRMALAMVAREQEEAWRNEAVRASRMADEGVLPFDY